MRPGGPGISSAPGSAATSHASRSPPTSRVAGFVVSWEPEEVADETYVSLVGTDPERRGEGIARALLTEVVAASADAGRPVVTLEVDADSPTGADRLYASIGFERALEAVIHGLPS